MLINKNILQISPILQTTQKRLKNFLNPLLVIIPIIIQNPSPPNREPRNIVRFPLMHNIRLRPVQVTLILLPHISQKVDVIPVVVVNPPVVVEHKPSFRELRLLYVANKALELAVVI